ncbi:hypothetical protein V8J79_07915 [Burkholderia pyrrocinia]
MMKREPKAASLSVSNGIRKHAGQRENHAEVTTDTIEIEPAPHREAMPDAPALSIRRIREARDGTPVLLRAIEHSDLEIERDLVDRLSSQSRYMRLMSARKPTEDEMIRWTRIDRRREGAVIATICASGRERLIGVARYALCVERRRNRCRRMRDRDRRCLASARARPCAVVEPDRSCGTVGHETDGRHDVDSDRG